MARGGPSWKTPRRFTASARLARYTGFAKKTAKKSTASSRLAKYTGIRSRITRRMTGCCLMPVIWAFLFLSAIVAILFFII